MSAGMLDRTLAAAMERHKSGALAEAERLYREALREDPSHADAAYLLGALLLAQGRCGDAAAQLERAVAVRPRHPAYLVNLGEAKRRLGQIEAARDALALAVQLKPDFAEAHYNLALALADARLMDEAAQAFERAAALKPVASAAHHRFAARANAAGGRTEAAIAAYRRALGLDGAQAEVLVELGDVLKDAGQRDEAVRCYFRALELSPSFGLAHHHLGIALLEAARVDEALGHLHRAAALRPHDAAVHNSLGHALKDVARLDEALAMYRRAIELAPLHRVAHSNLVYTLSFHPGYGPSDILREARRWESQHASVPVCAPQADVDRSPDRRLRIGYVSPDFREHCQAFFMRPLLASHDREQVEVFCYSSVGRADPRTEELASLSSCFRRIDRLDDATAAELIRGDRIDVLVDLTMHMADNRLLVLARRPAPIQVSWLAYPGTTGLSAIDYRVTDRYLDPPEADTSVYSERTVRLPDTFWCYDPLTTTLEVGPLPAERGGFLTFGCLNNFCKVNSGVLAAWARVLAAVERSRLLLLAPPGQSREWVRAELAAHGVAPDRVEFIYYLPRPSYLAEYDRIDVCLDTFPYNGHTTSLDAFWMGVPVVTLVGPTVVGRAGLSQAMNLGLDGLVAHSVDEMVAIASRLAHDLSGLARLRGELRARMRASPLMDAQRFARNLEAAYRTMWLARLGADAGGQGTHSIVPTA